MRHTIEDILKNSSDRTEIIAVCDGALPLEPIADHPRLTLVILGKSIGQRAATNLAARLSKAPYLMKVDAHCAFDTGFDEKMLAVMQPDFAMVPTMRNLHVFDWVCEDGHRRYQGPSGNCEVCGKPTTKDIVWIAKNSPQSNAYAFNSEPHFIYFREFNKRPEGKGDLTETMSLQGSCFMVSREKYWELNICDEGFGSWGSQGIEVAVKTWLSGGRVMVNQTTWYAHLFRTGATNAQGEKFGFPYELSQSQVDHAKRHARELFFNNQWNKAIYPLSWLVERFAPVPGWSEADLAELKATEKPKTKGIVYYSDNRLDSTISAAVQKQIKKSINGHQVISTTLQPMDFGKNICLPLERGYLTMFRQILAGLEASTADIIFLCEHDVLYSKQHFDFIPPRRDVFYYNINVWKVDAETGRALRVDECKQTSGLCAYRDLLLTHYRKRVAIVEEFGFSRKQGFEPGSHNRAERIDDYKSDVWSSEVPNLDIRHGLNLTPSRWKREQFRDQRYTKGWTEADAVPGWGQTQGRMIDILRGLADADN